MAKQTKISMIEALANRNMTKRQAFNELRPLVENQIPPMIFTANPSASDKARGIVHRQPLPMNEQFIRLQDAIGRTYNAMGRSKDKSFESEEINIGDSDFEGTTFEIQEISEEQENAQIEEEILEAMEEISSRPQSAGKKRIQDSLWAFLHEVRRLRTAIAERAQMNSEMPIDWLSMRPVQAASKLIPAGVPFEALIDTMTIHWSPGTRSDLGVRDFDFVKYSRQIMKERGIKDVPSFDNPGETEPAHDLFGWALILAENRQPIYLCGPAGTGKSHIAKQLAAYFGMEYGNFNYGETPMSPGATRGDLLGRHTAGGFMTAEFSEIYGSGGVFNFEEIDAADAGMLIVLNNALASQSLYNSASGQTIKRHDFFIAVCTANTWGMGSTSQYIREKLDFATIDRWRMGRLFIGLDENVEERILFSVFNRMKFDN